MSGASPPVAPGGGKEKPAGPRSPVKKAASAGLARANAVAGKGRQWVERQDPASRQGATIGWYRRHVEAGGQLYTVLLTAYVFIAVLPAVLVMTTYLSDDPAALADRVIHRLRLTGSTAELFHGVLTGAGENQLGSMLIAVANVLIFGMGVGRVLQFAHARSWRIDLGKPGYRDQARYLTVLVVALGLIFIALLQTKLLGGAASWIEWALLPVWAVVLVGYLVWAPRLLLHNRVSVRNVVPGAVFTAFALVGLRLISHLLFKHWLEWYSQYYGGLGIVMALFFG